MAESDTTYTRSHTMFRRRRMLTLAAALALAPAALLAQDSTAAAGSSADAQVSAALDAALEAGIPVSLLERKIAEGKAKGVPMDRIAAAVEKRLEALTAARDAMGRAGLESTTEGELSVAADAVQAGVSQSALLAISQRAPGESRTVAIAVLADLVAQGRQSEEQALSRVEAALARGGEALANLGAQAGGQAHGEAGLGAGGVGVGAGAVTGARVELGGKPN
jgi:hypothetical protein